MPQNQKSFFATLKKDLRDIQHFYLSQEQLEKIKRRSFLIRYILLTFSILKALYFKLNPFRRVLFIMALLLLFSFQAQINSGSYYFGFNMPVLAGLLLIFILLLELKDKLLFKDEIQAARAIQNALIPQTQPAIEGFDIHFYYQPMNEIGGDLIDHLQLGSGKHLLALADISGKGLSAALLMSRLQSLLQAFVYDVPFAQLMTVINQKFYRTVPNQSFASLLLLQLEEKNSGLQLLNGGHLPPILCSRGQIQTLPKGGMAIGLQEQVDYQSYDITLQPGDILFCYSDGLSEAFNLDQQPFGELRIQEILKQNANRSAQKIIGALLQELNLFVGDQELSDDLSLIVIKRKE